MAHYSDECPFMKDFDQLAARQLVVVTGKGGVGKTTLAASFPPGRD
jgi:predicted ATPase